MNHGQAAVGWNIPIPVRQAESRIAQELRQYPLVIVKVGPVPRQKDPGLMHVSAVGVSRASEAVYIRLLRPASRVAGIAHAQFASFR